MINKFLWYRFLPNILFRIKYFFKSINQIQTHETRNIRYVHVDDISFVKTLSAISKILRTSNIGGYSTLKDTFVETPKRIWLHLWTIEDEQIGCVYTFWLAMPPDIGFET